MTRMCSFCCSGHPKPYHLKKNINKHVIFHVETVECHYILPNSIEMSSLAVTNESPMCTHTCIPTFWAT